MQHSRKRKVREPLHARRGWTGATVVGRMLDESALRCATRQMGEEMPRRSKARCAGGRTDTRPLEYLLLAQLRDEGGNPLRAWIPEIRERETRAESTAGRRGVEAEYPNTTTKGWLICSVLFLNYKYNKIYIFLS